MVRSMTTAIDPQSKAILTTADSLFRMSGDGQRYELVRGRGRETSPAGFEHGVITNHLSSLLTDVVNRASLGVVLGAETGFVLARNPDTDLGPDVSFVSRSKIERIGTPTSFFPEAPDLAVEVVSPNDRVSEVEAKAADWLNGGTRLLWIVSARSRTVTVYQSLQQIAVLTENDRLGGGVVPGFSCRVGGLFQPLFPGSPPN